MNHIMNQADRINIGRSERKVEYEWIMPVIIELSQ